MQREHRYIVIKVKDMQAALSDDDKMLLSCLATKVAKHRAAQGKPDLECVVVESDWPEYEPTWQAIERRVEYPSLCGRVGTQEGER